MRLSLVPLIAGVLVTSACTSEATNPIDLGATTTTTVDADTLEAPEVDPNAEARNQVIELAIEECRKDPSAEFGVIVIADENGVEVNRYEHPCDEVRAEDAQSEGIDDSAGEE